MITKLPGHSLLLCAFATIPLCRQLFLLIFSISHTIMVFENYFFFGFIVPSEDLVIEQYEVPDG
jgi:hypothetical protein